jgi:hypothetical protein
MSTIQIVIHSFYLYFRMDNQIPRFGGQGSQDQLYYAPDQWPYQLQSSIDPLECPQSEQVSWYFIKLFIIMKLCS